MFHYMYFFPPYNVRGVILVQLVPQQAGQNYIYFKENFLVTAPYCLGYSAAQFFQAPPTVQAISNSNS